MLHYFEIGFNWNFKSGIFCTLPVSGMCCSPVYTHTHNSTAEWRWIEGGVNDLTEDSVELTPATEQTICSFHQQLWSKKKKKKRRGWEEMSYKTQRGWGGGFDEKVCGCRMQQLSRTWLRFWGDLLVRGNLSGSFSFIPNRRTTVALLPELIMFGARKQLLNSNDKSFIGCNAYKFITQSDRETVLNWLCAFVFIEVGKNINQDKALSLKRFVEDYHKYVNSLNIPLMKSHTKDQRRENQRARRRNGNSS